MGATTNSGSLMYDILEVLHPLASEFVMFALAAIIYLLSTRAFMVPDKRKKKAGLIEKVAEVEESSRKGREPRKLWKKEMEETSHVYHSILQHAKNGDAPQALAALAALEAPAKASLPQSVATKVLLTLARSSDLCENLMHKFTDLSAFFDVRVFEAAAAEASRWRSIQACRQLFHLAGVASIHKTEKLLVLLVRGHSNDQEAMHALLEEILAQSGTTLARSTLEALAAQCSAASNRKSAKLLQEQLDATGSGHDAGRQARLISNYGKEGNLAAALDIFEKLKECGGLTVLVYNCLLDACIECRDLPRALQLFQEMKEKSLADVVSYNTIMKGHLGASDTQAAHRVFSDMTAAGLLPSRVTYHALLNAIIQKGDRGAAWRLVKEMQNKGIGANTITCTILLKSISGGSHGQELWKILELSDASEVSMDEVLFGAVADACIRCGNLKLLWDRFRKVTAGEKPIQVSGPTYGSMMKAFGQAHDVPRVKDLWSHMSTRDVKLTAVTLGCMVEALVANNNVGEAWQIVNDIWAKDEQRDLVNTVIYSTIVKGFTMSRQHDKVVAIYKEMKERGIPCNTITYNTMLNALARCGMMHEVPQLLEDMRDSNPPVQPDIVTYSTIVKGYCMAGEVDKAFALLREMRKCNAVTPDEVLYNSLLDGCAKQSRVDEALTLLEEMKTQGVVPSNYTLSILCKLLGRARRLDQAFNMVQSFTQEYGFKANIQVYTCLMQACIHNRQCHRVLSLHDQVVKSGTCTPDEKTYTVMLRGCLQSGLNDKALAVARCAYHLQGHNLQETRGAAPGVEAQCLEELLGSLGPGSSRDALIKDLYQHHGLSVSPPSQAPRRPRVSGRGR